MKSTQVWGDLFSPIKPVDFHPFTCHPVLTSITGEEDKSPTVIVIVTLSGVHSVWTTRSGAARCAGQRMQGVIFDMKVVSRLTRPVSRG